MAVWESFKDRKNSIQPFEVTEQQKNLLKYIENVLKATPLVANTPKGKNVTVCYRFQNQIEVGLMLLEKDQTTVYINEKTVKFYFLYNTDLNHLVTEIEKEALFEDLKKEKLGRIYPHFYYKNPNTTVLRKEVETLSPTKESKLYVISGLDIQVVESICELISDNVLIKKDENSSSSSHKKSDKELSPEELIKKLERQSEIGKKGELFAIEYEKKRLKDSYLSITEAQLEQAIKHIAITDVATGYDIESHYNGESRYIEVKTTISKAESDFFFSLNEYEVLKAKGEEAYIYRIVFEEKGSNPEVIELNDPFGERHPKKLKPVAFQANLNDFEI